MLMFRAEGKSAFRAYAAALAEEHEAAHELAECSKIEVYHLLAADLYNRVSQAHEKTLLAYHALDQFKHSG